MSYRELLLGCGYARDKRLQAPGADPTQWQSLHTADRNPACEPDWLVDMMARQWHITANNGQSCHPYPLPAAMFDEVHAYEVLEHLGMQGDALEFFITFNEIYRVLKPGGYLCATVPSRYSPWLWGDPGHTRVILPQTLVFLSQKAIDENRALKTSMSDYDGYRKCNFDIIRSDDDKSLHRFILQKVK